MEAGLVELPPGWDRQLTPPAFLRAAHGPHIIHGAEEGCGGCQTEGGLNTREFLSDFNTPGPR